MYGLSDALLEQIKSLAQRFGVARLVLFGSRARGDFRASSEGLRLRVYASGRPS